MVVFWEGAGVRGTNILHSPAMPGGRGRCHGDYVSVVNSARTKHHDISAFASRCPPTGRRLSAGRRRRIEPRRPGPRSHGDRLPGKRR